MNHHHHQQQQQHHHHHHHHHSPTTSNTTTTSCSLEEQVAQAALAMVQPTTDSVTRRQASQFLEEWTKTPEAWEVYTKWLASYRQEQTFHASQQQQHPHQPYLLAMQLLCLTMLQSKLRKEIRRSQPWHPSVGPLRIELWEYLKQLQQSQQEHHQQQQNQRSVDQSRTMASASSLLGPCCICNAAMMVRSSDGMLAEFMMHLGNTIDANGQNNGSIALPRETTLRLLACIPAEMEACQDMTNSQVTAELTVHLEIVLDTVRKGLVENPFTLLPACQALKSWTEIAHISLTQLNTPTCGGPHAVLPTLIHLLSSSNHNTNHHQQHSTPALNNNQGVSPIHETLPYDEITLQVAAQALTDAIMVVSDHCSPTRSAAAGAFWTAISRQGFIVNPLRVATINEWNDACHALASLLSTFVCEQVDDLVAQPADMGLQVLFDIQAHPHTPVALIPLECWLTIQEISMDDRHEHWKRPLYRKLVETLIARIAYPQSFTTWEDELQLDASEFFEFRRMVTDVLVSCYFLLRVEMVQLLIHRIRTAASWSMSEAGLFALSQISKDVCARCNSRAADGTMVARDRQATCHELLQLLDQLMSVNIHATEGQHPLLLGAVVNFCGSFSPAWNSMDCPPQAILQLLTYLQAAFGTLPMEAAKATRAIYVSCLAKSMPNLEDFSIDEGRSSPTSILPLVLKSVRDSLEAVLSTTEEEAMTMVAEGATRLVTKLMDPHVARQALTTDLIQPVLNRVSVALQALPDSKVSEDWMTPEVQAAMECLARYLSVIQVIARFCDAPHIPAMGEWFLQQIGSCLESVQRQTAGTPAQPLVLPKWITIHQQILRNILPRENTTIAIFRGVVPLIVQALEQTQDPATLKYISTAVENFGGKTVEMDESFQDLLAHVTTIVTSQSNLSEATELLQAFFDCLQRFILYCPRALCYNPQFVTIVTLAIESISAIQAKESTRAALMFLSQLFGWNSLRLSPQTIQVMQEAWNSSSALKEMLVRNGQTLVQACFIGLAGGSQMLWPAYSDCLFAITQAVVLNQTEEEINPADPSVCSLSEVVIQHWLRSGMTVAICSGSHDGCDIDPETCNQITSILLDMARQGPKSRSKAKMLLTDFAKIKKGEMSTDSLVSYTLP